MKRLSITPRVNYTEIVSNLGFNFSANYWNESNYYTFTEEESDEISKVSNEAYGLYCDMVQNVIDRNLFHRFGISDPELIYFIKTSWNDDDLSLYGRFDLVYDTNHNLKLLEFNADTPTSLFEAAVVQWQWKEDVMPSYDQSNVIHESLVQSWKDIHNVYGYDRYDFGCITDIDEENTTTSYLLSTCSEAGLNTSMLDLSDIVRCNDSFYLPTGEPINCMFKLYPWEDLLEDEFGKFIPDTQMIWIEPVWKMLMSSKESLVLLTEMFSPSEYKFLVPAYDRKPMVKDYVIKPRYGREGQNVEIVLNRDSVLKTDGHYSEDKVIFQDFVDIKKFDNNVPIIGAWIIGGEFSGIGIRESESLVTDNMARFVPHLIGIKE